VRRALGGPEVEALRSAEAALAGVPEAPPAEPIRFEVAEHTLACSTTALVALERPGLAPLAREVTGVGRATDASHPALPAADLDEDPLRYPRAETTLRQEARGAVAAEVAALLGAELARRGLATVPAGEPPADDEAREAGARQVLLALRLDPSAHRAEAGAWLLAAFGLDDLDALPRP
jgi:hypothetical protein